MLKKRQGVRRRASWPKWRFIALGIMAAFFLPFVLFGFASAGYVTCEGVKARTAPAPLYGKNFRPYCFFCIFALRTFAREEVVETLVDSYTELASVFPQTVFVYGEMGFPWGGRFWPHRTHRKGLSVDLMAPLKNGNIMKLSPFNRFGYDAEFDAQGNGQNGGIDFDALAGQLLSLKRHAEMRGGRIVRVFLAPDLQAELFAAKGGRAVQAGLRFNGRQSWVRHDEHVHVDFFFPCHKAQG